MQAELPWAQNAHQRRPALAGRLGRLRLPGLWLDQESALAIALRPLDGRSPVSPRGSRADLPVEPWFRRAEGLDMQLTTKIVLDCMAVMAKGGLRHAALAIGSSFNRMTEDAFAERSAALMARILRDGGGDASAVERQLAEVKRDKSAPQEVLDICRALWKERVTTGRGVSIARATGLISQRMSRAEAGAANVAALAATSGQEDIVPVAPGDLGITLQLGTAKPGSSARPPADWRRASNVLGMADAGGGSAWQRMEGVVDAAPYVAAYTRAIAIIKTRQDRTLMGMAYHEVRVHA